MELFQRNDVDQLKMQYSCDCGRSFKKASQLNYHIRRIHRAEKNHCCTHCDKAFFKKSDLESHLFIHGNDHKCVCKFCGRSFKHISNMNRHIRTHTGVKPYPCSVCSKRFSQVSALQQHTQTEHHRAKCAELDKMTPPADLPLMPELAFEDPDDPDGECRVFDRYIDSGNDKKWWFYCVICDRRFQLIEQLRDHENNHVLNKDIHCRLCDLKFESISALKAHGCGKSKMENKPNIATSSRKPQAPTEIGVSHSSLMNANSGELVEKSADETALNSSVELSLAGNGQILLDNNEVLLIMNDKLYGAVLVNSDVTVVENDAVTRVLNGLTPSRELAGSEHYSTAESYSSHSSIPLDTNVADMEEKEQLFLLEWWMTDNKIGDKEQLPDTERDALLDETGKCGASAKPKTLFKCKECGRIFNKKNNYQQHLGTHFANQKRFECPMCNLHFAWKSTVGKHIAREHSERNQYTCEQCGKSYNSSIVLRYHIQRDHLNMKEHKCAECDKSFFRKWELKLHLRKHNDEKPYVCRICGKSFRHSSNNIRHERLHLKQLSDSVL